MKIKSLVLALILVISSTVPTLAKAVTYKLGTGDPENSEQGYAAKVFADYVKEKSKGSIEIQNFYNGALGDESECLRNVQKGSLPFTVAGIANLVPFEKRLGILTLPYLFSNLDEVVAGTNGEAAKLLGSYANDSGFRILTWTYTDFRYISNSKRPITKIADIKGLKFRVPQSAVLIAAYNAFGGSPTPISWAETFTALQQGVVDGQCYGYIGFNANRFDEANQKYISEVHYTYQLQPLVMSERVYKKMSSADQRLMIEAGMVAQEAVLKYQIEEGGKAKEEILRKGIVISKLTDEEKWKRAAFKEVWPEMAEFVGGEDAINAYLKAAGLPLWQPE